MLIVVVDRIWNAHPAQQQQILFSSKKINGISHTSHSLMSCHSLGHGGKVKILPIALL